MARPAPRPPRGVWSNDEFYALGEKLERSTKLEDRRAAFRAMMDINEWTDPGVITLYQNAVFYGIRDNVDWKPYVFFYMDLGPNRSQVQLTNRLRRHAAGASSSEWIDGPARSRKPVRRLSHGQRAAACRQRCFLLRRRGRNPRHCRGKRLGQERYLPVIGRPSGSHAPMRRARCASWIPATRSPNCQRSNVRSRPSISHDLPGPGRQPQSGPHASARRSRKCCASAAAWMAARLAIEAIDLLDRVGITQPEARLPAYPHQMSGGMNQRIMIAMALAGAPRLLIADEPTTALDVTIQAQICRLLRDLVRETGLSIIFISHDLDLVAQFCDRVAVMYAGSLVEVQTRPRHRRPRRAIPIRGRCWPPFPATSRPARGWAIFPEKSAPISPRRRECAFAPRCASRLDACAAAVPAIVRLRHQGRSRMLQPQLTPTCRHFASIGVRYMHRPAMRPLVVGGASRPRPAASRRFRSPSPAGTTLGLIGESGCGKSTLASLIIGDRRPQAGNIEIFGTSAGRPAGPGPQGIGPRHADGGPGPVRLDGPAPGHRPADRRDARNPRRTGLDGRAARCRPRHARARSACRRKLSPNCPTN